MRINRTNTIHIFAIIAVLLMPVMFMRPEEKLTFTLYLFKCVTSIAMITVFYLNFLFPDKGTAFFLINQTFLHYRSKRQVSYPSYIFSKEVCVCAEKIVPLQAFSSKRHTINY